MFFLFFLWLSDVPCISTFSLMPSLDKMGPLTNIFSSSKNCMKSFNDDSFCRIFYSISVFLFHLSTISLSNFETSIHRVSFAVSLAFLFVSNPRLLDLFKKAKHFGMTLHPNTLLVADSLVPQCKVHNILCGSLYRFYSNKKPYELLCFTISSLESQINAPLTC